MIYKNMYIKLTNANETHNGQPIVINSEHIVSINRASVERNGFLQEITFLFIPPHGTWEVKESVDEILDMLK